jgi:putative resolvase
MDNKSERIMKILKSSKAAELLGVHVKTLQRLDREGTLVAARTATGRRYYTEDQLYEFLGKDKPVTETTIK